MTGRARCAALAACAVAVASVLLPAPARAHEMTMAEMEVRETAPGEFLWQWSAQNDKRPMGDDLTPQLARRLRDRRPNVAALRRRRAEGHARRSTASASATPPRMVKVVWLDGAEPRLHAHQRRSRRCSSTARRTTSAARGEIARAYIVLGVEHILSGFDHLLFVAGLLFLVGFRRRLIGTITAFTLAHSLTLACSAFGWLTLRSPPVEAAIALSIVLVASEALRERDTLARRLPALVSFLFGLVHGLGFAGALKEHRPAAEPPAAGAAHLQRRRRDRPAADGAGRVRASCACPISRAGSARARRPALYGIGALAAYWSWLRIAAIAF